MFNDSRYARRNGADSVRALANDTRFAKTASGFDVQPELGPDAQDRSLIEDVGLSEEIVDRLRAALPGTSISGG